jgi:hypothetical protein
MDQEHNQYQAAQSQSSFPFQAVMALSPSKYHPLLILFYREATMQLRRQGFPPDLKQNACVRGAEDAQSLRQTTCLA